MPGAPISGEPQQQLCVACHEAVGRDLANGSGLHGRHPDASGATGAQCQTCHAEHEGRNAETLEFSWDVFDHQLTDFPRLNFSL